MRTGVTFSTGRRASTGGHPGSRRCWQSSYDLEKTGDLDYVEATLAKVLACVPGELVPADAAECAVAAAEVLARLKGNWGEENSYSETVDQWA